MSAADEAVQPPRLPPGRPGRDRAGAVRRLPPGEHTRDPLSRLPKRLPSPRANGVRCPSRSRPADRTRRSCPDQRAAWLESDCLTRIIRLAGHAVQPGLAGGRRRGQLRGTDRRLRLQARLGDPDGQRAQGAAGFPRGPVGLGPPGAGRLERRRARVAAAAGHHPGSPPCATWPRPCDGHTLRVAGTFGPQTEKAVGAFQRATAAVPLVGPSWFGGAAGREPPDRLRAAGAVRTA